jgi:hypothetical protein
MSKEYRPYVLLFCMAVGLSIMYSVYLFEFDQGMIEGGTLERTLLKLFFMLSFSFSIYQFLDIKSILVNFAVKLPLVFLLLFSLVASLTVLEGSYTQAINIVFFAPVLFVNWNKRGGDNLYKYIWKVIALTVIVQLVMDPVLKAYTGVRWENNALIGGMGNPNVYGLFLLVTAVYLYLYSKSFLRMLSVPVALIAILTGSLVCGLVAVLLAFMIMIRYFMLGGYIAKGALLLLCFTLFSFGALFTDADLTEFGALEHAVGKIKGLLSNSFVDAGGELASVGGRLDYINEGLELMKDDPVSLLVGHPHYLPMFNGDGTWVSFIVTHGIPFTLLFQLSNLYIIVRAFRSTKVEFAFSIYILIMFQVFFVTNRILDYWPAGFLYLLAFSYCATRGVYRTNAAGLVH